MEAKKQSVGEDDLSMEEILQSIRRIIADDDEGRNKEAGAGGNGASNILELTDMIEEDGSVTNLKDAPKADASVDVLKNIDAALVPEAPVREIKLNSQPAAAPQAAPKNEAAMDNDSGSLLSKTVENAAMSALAKLNVPETPLQPITPPPQFRSGGTVEDLVEELLKPMMVDWLNNNLPSIVERIVEREVLRLTRK
jgi:uncharacterized protein